MPHETEQLACDFMYVHDEIVQKVRRRCRTRMCCLT